MEKVVRLLDLEKEKSDADSTCMYTFANLDDDLCDLEDLEIEEVRASNLI